MGIWRKLKGDNVRVIEDLDNKKVKREEDPCLQDRLAEGHIVEKGEVRSLIFGSPASRVPQPKLARNETQLLVRKTRDPVLADMSQVRVRGRHSTG